MCVTGNTRQLAHCGSEFFVSLLSVDFGCKLQAMNKPPWSRMSEKQVCKNSIWIVEGRGLIDPLGSQLGS